MECLPLDLQVELTSYLFARPTARLRLVCRAYAQIFGSRDYWFKRLTRRTAYLALPANELLTTFNSFPVAPGLAYVLTSDYYDCGADRPLGTLQRLRAGYYMPPANLVRTLIANEFGNYTILNRYMGSVIINLLPLILIAQDHGAAKLAEVLQPRVNSNHPIINDIMGEARQLAEFSARQRAVLLQVFTAYECDQVVSCLNALNEGRDRGARFKLDYDITNDTLKPVNLQHLAKIRRNDFTAAEFLAFINARENYALSDYLYYLVAKYQRVDVIEEALVHEDSQLFMKRLAMVYAYVLPGTPLADYLEHAEIGFLRALLHIVKRLPIRLLIILLRIAKKRRLPNLNTYFTNAAPAYWFLQKEMPELPATLGDPYATTPTGAGGVAPPHHGYRFSNSESGSESD